MLIHYIDLNAGTLVSSMLIWLIYTSFSVLTCSDVGMILLLPSMPIPSMTAISSLNDQKSCSSFCTSGFVDSQLHSTCSANALWCSFSRVHSLISSAIMQSGMSVINSIALMVMCMPCISSPLFILFLCLHTNLQWAVVVLVYICFWYCIDVSTVVFFEVCLIDLQHLSWILLPAVCGLWPCWPCRQSSRGDIFSRPCSMPSTFISLLL